MTFSSIINIGKYRELGTERAVKPPAKGYVRIVVADTAILQAAYQRDYEEKRYLLCGCERKITSSKREIWFRGASADYPPTGKAVRDQRAKPKEHMWHTLGIRNRLMLMAE